MNLFPVDKMDGLSCCMNLYSPNNSFKDVSSLKCFSFYLRLLFIVKFVGDITVPVKITSYKNFHPGLDHQWYT